MRVSSVQQSKLCDVLAKFQGLSRAYPAGWQPHAIAASPEYKVRAAPQQRAQRCSRALRAEAQPAQKLKTKCQSPVSLNCPRSLPNARRARSQVPQRCCPLICISHPVRQQPARVSHGARQHRPLACGECGPVGRPAAHVNSARQRSAVALPKACQSERVSLPCRNRVQGA